MLTYTMRMRCSEIVTPNIMFMLYTPAKGYRKPLLDIDNNLQKFTLLADIMLQYALKEMNKVAF